MLYMVSNWRKRHFKFTQVLGYIYKAGMKKERNDIKPALSSGT